MAKKVNSLKREYSCLGEYYSFHLVLYMIYVILLEVLLTNEILNESTRLIVMPPETIKSFDLKIPTHFPIVSYDAIYARVFNKFQKDKTSGKSTDDFAWQQFIRSWAAVAYRFRANFEHSQAYIKIVEPFRYTITALDSETQYNQERELFDFFINGLSTIESLYYSLYFIGAFADKTVFDHGASFASKLRDIKPDMTSDKYKKYAKTDKTSEADVMSNELENLLSTPQYKELKDTRNTLAHSIVPMRTNLVNIVESVYEGTTSSSQGTVWLNNIQLDINTTVTRQSWLAQMLDTIIKAADVFTSSKF